MFEILYMLSLLIECANMTEQNNKVHQPNIIWIMADDLGYGDLGCYGQQLMKTPCLDRMAQEGVRFTDCYAGAHMCAPSRATLLTGKHEGHSSVREIWFRGPGRAYLHPKETTIAQVLRQAGYATAIFGKTHAMGIDKDELAEKSRHFGFDHFLHDYEYAQNWLGPNFPLSVVSQNGITEFPVNAEIERTMTEKYGSEPKEHTSGYIEKYEDYDHGAYMDDLYTQAACDYIGTKPEEPFFIYLSLRAPHTKYLAPGIGKYINEDWDPFSKGYVAMVERMDAHVGQVLNALAEAGMDDETIVFFTSDNGGVCRDGIEGVNREDWTAFRERIKPNRDLRKGKHYHFEGGIRIPMIVRWPGRIEAASVSDVPWYFADAFPTLAGIAGTTGLVPDDVDGVSVLPTLHGEDQPELDERPMYWEAHKFFGFYQVVRKGNWKLIRWTKRGPRQHPLGDIDPVLPVDQYPMLELYNLAEDHREECSLADKETAVTAELLSLLNSAQAHTDDPDWPITKEERRAMELYSHASD